jgi:hypothetical protein
MVRVLNWRFQGESLIDRVVVAMSARLTLPGNAPKLSHGRLGGESSIFTRMTIATDLIGMSISVVPPFSTNPANSLHRGDT